MNIYIILTLIISVFVAWFTIPNIVIISKKKRLFDVPDARKVHVKSIPRLGGMSFYPGMLFSFTVTLGIRYMMGDGLDVLFENSFITEYLFFSAGIISLFFVGMADDLVGVSYKNKFLVQILASILLICSGVYLKSFHGLFGIWDIPDFLGMPITVILVVLIVNAYNLIDGVDGLCSGLSSIAIAVLCGWYWYNSLFVYASLGIGLLGTVIVFFLYNVTSSRLKVFMGDGGSLMLGFVICFLGLKFCNFNMNDNIFNTSNVPILLLSIVFIPVFDTARVFIDRLSMKRSPFYPDKIHIHHYILRLGFTHLQSTSIILIGAIFIVVINFVLQKMNINILFAIDLLFGLIFLNYLPKRMVKKRESVNNKKTSVSINNK